MSKETKTSVSDRHVLYLGQAFPGNPLPQVNAGDWVALLRDEQDNLVVDHVVVGSGYWDDEFKLKAYGHARFILETRVGVTPHPFDALHWE
jgi:hypothetical protein